MRTSTVLLTHAAFPDALASKAVELFSVRWKERTSIKLSPRLPAGVTAAWELKAGTAADSSLLADLKTAGIPLPEKPQAYAIASTGRTLTVCGSDSLGLLFGLGWLLRHLELEPERAPMPAMSETRTPAVYNRGVYLATHFNNYYETAPLERIDRYIEELALWGFDLLMFWFDANWFPYGFWKDPASRGSTMAARLRHIGEKARACGLKVGTMGLGNEGFAHQPPPKLQVDISGRHGGFYPFSQICASKPGGLRMILENRRKIMELVGPVDTYTHWPYDQGGCGCEQCSHAPGRWGKKFLELAAPIAEIVRKANPDVQFFISTWLMDETERAMVYALCDQKADWFQGIMTQTNHAAERPLDPRYKWMVFPEISMFDCYFTSYGCNGGNPAPARMETESRKIALAGCGTALYSEGLYEDVNKAIYASLLWDPTDTAEHVLEEYTRYYFGRKNVKAGVRLLRDLETTWGARALLKAAPATVARLAAEAKKLNERLPPFRDAIERGRLLSGRAEMDLLMKQAGPDRQLVEESRALYEGTAYLPAGELWKRVDIFLARLKERKTLTDRLFESHWNYMTFFHMEKNVLAFLPDTVMGKHNWESLIGPLSKASRANSERALRPAVSRAFKRWYWFNGIDTNYLFF